MTLVTLVKSARIFALCSVNMHIDGHSEKLLHSLSLLKGTFLAVFLKPVSEFKYA